MSRAPSRRKFHQAWPGANSSGPDRRPKKSVAPGNDAAPGLRAPAALVPARSTGPGDLLCSVRRPPGALAPPAPARDDPCVRMTPIIGEKPWFGPRRVGWGLAPISLEGWALTALFAALTAVAKRQGLAKKPMQVLLGSFSVVVALKGTSPGGPRRRRTFDLERARLTSSGEIQAA
jgi:hypothetical protein